MVASSISGSPENASDIKKIRFNHFSDRIFFIDLQKKVKNLIYNKRPQYRLATVQNSDKNGIGIAQAALKFNYYNEPNESSNLCLPPKPYRKLVRKTKSSNNQPQIRNSQNGTPRSRQKDREQMKNQQQNRSASYRNFQQASLHCPNLTTIKDYDIQVLIGQGAFGVVKRATKKGSNLKVAMKQYDKSKLFQDAGRVESLKAEIETLTGLNHIGIMKFYDAIDSGSKVTIIVEYINGNNLFQYIRKLPGQRISDENDVKKIFIKIVEAIDYMHESNVVHRDLKLENILIDRQSKETKIIDFGFSVKVKDAQESKLQYLCGTPIYMCPEMAQKKEHYGAPADIWALGVVLFILLTGKMPFHGSFEDDLFRKISQCKYQWPDYLTDKKGEVVELSSGAKGLVKRIFVLNQKQRPTAKQILQDSWLQKVKWD